MSHSELTRSIRLYPIYALLAQADFWLPVFFLYFNQHMPIEQVLRLEAIYYVAVVILEVPSGYLSDTLGRRLTLLISAVSAIFAYALFFLGGSFGVFALAQIGLAASMAFRSGTDTSFHYDLLKCLGREDAYPQREARITRNVFIASAGAALLGGGVSVYALRAAYGLSLLAACVAFVTVLFFAEPDRESSSASGGQTSGFFSQIRACFAYLGQPVLGWLMLFSVFMTVINHIPYEFYQPYILLLGGRGSYSFAYGVAHGADDGYCRVVCKTEYSPARSFRYPVGAYAQCRGAGCSHFNDGVLFSPCCCAAVGFSLCPSRTYDCASQCGDCAAFATTPSRDVSFDSESDWAFVIFALSCSSCWCFRRSRCWAVTYAFVLCGFCHCGVYRPRRYRCCDSQVAVAVDF